MPNIHPLFVHLPIALLTISFIFDLLGHLRKQNEFERTAWWTLLGGMIGLIGTISTGLIAEHSVVISEAAREHFQMHEQTAFAVGGMYSILFLWRIASRTQLPKSRETMYLALSFLGVVLLWIGAWYGGELVFRFGVGVQATQ